MDSIKDDWGAAWFVIDAARNSYGEDMAAFLCWLGVRLMEMHRVLRQDGSIYLHIDHTAHAYVKALMDGIFGAKNFQNEVVWHYGLGGSSRRRYSRKHDTLLFYTKSSNYYFDKPQEPAKSMRMRGQMKGISDVWNIPTINNMAKERTGYPTQKPLTLYERIVQASSQRGDFVLDPFCGCATTPIAAERLRRQWIGMDIWDGAHDIVLKRLEDEGLASPATTSDRLITFGDITYTSIPPIRTDDNEMAAPGFRLRMQRPTEPWQKLSHKQIFHVLATAQRGAQNFIVCAGCGRQLEREFMELDHITPKSDRGENHIMNRILLCRPCNGRKRDKLTLRGLVSENKKRSVGWMKDEAWANIARDNAAGKAEWVRDNFGTLECESLLQAA